MVTGLLFFFIVLALVPLALRNSGARELRRQRTREIERMTIGAHICEATARDAFGVELDHSTDSIPMLDALITKGWSDGTGTTYDLPTDNYEPTFVLGSYLGNVFTHHEKAEWQWENAEPFLYFRNLKQRNSPFELIERKLSNPTEVNLEQETALWLHPNPPQDSDANTTS